MPFRAALRHLATWAVAILAVFAVRCGSSPEDTSGGAICDEPLPSVTYGGDTTDEALVSIWQARCEAVADAELAPSLTSPAAGAALSASTPPTLSWSPQLTFAPASAPAPRQRKDIPFISVGLPRAWAHGTPVNGWVYLVELKSGGTEAWGFTTETSWTVDQARWDALVAGGGPLEVRIFTAYLRDNGLEEGPWVAPAAAAFAISEP